MFGRKLRALDNEVMLYRDEVEAVLKEIRSLRETLAFLFKQKESTTAKIARVIDHLGLKEKHIPAEPAKDVLVPKIDPIMATMDRISFFEFPASNGEFAPIKRVKNKKKTAPKKRGTSKKKEAPRYGGKK